MIITKEKVEEIIYYLKKNKNLSKKYEETISPYKNLKNILEDLEILTINDEIPEILKKNLNLCTNLNSLYFANCSKLTSENINKIKNDCEINIEFGIRNIRDLETLDLKFGDKEPLNKILIKECENLETLSLKDVNPKKALKQQVQKIDIENCKNLKKLTISGDTNIQASISEMTIFNCDNIKKISLNKKVQCLNIYLSDFDHRQIQTSLGNNQHIEKFIRLYVETKFLERVEIRGIEKFTCYVCFSGNKYEPIIQLRKRQNNISQQDIS